MNITALSVEVPVLVPIGLIACVIGIVCMRMYKRRVMLIEQFTFVLTNLEFYDEDFAARYKGTKPDVVTLQKLEERYWYVLMSKVVSASPEGTRVNSDLHEFILRVGKVR